MKHINYYKLTPGGFKKSNTMNFFLSQLPHSRTWIRMDLKPISEASPNTVTGSVPCSLSLPFNPLHLPCTTNTSPCSRLPITWLWRHQPCRDENTKQQCPLGCAGSAARNTHLLLGATTMETWFPRTPIKLLENIIKSVSPPAGNPPPGLKVLLYIYCSQT